MKNNIAAIDLGAEWDRMIEESDAEEASATAADVIAARKAVIHGWVS